MNKEKLMNNLFFQILVTLLVGIIGLTAALSMINIKASKQVFIDTFTESQEKIFTQIDIDFYKFYQDITTITSSINANEVIRNYLLEGHPNVIEERNNILFMKRALAELPIADYSNISLLLIGSTGKSFNNSTDKLAVTVEEIWKDEVVIRAVKNPKQLICQHEEAGYTDVMKRDPVVIMAKAMSAKDGVYGVILLTIKEEDFLKMSSRFTGGTSDLVIFNQDDEVIASNNKSYFAHTGKTYQLQDILKEMKEDGIKQKEVHQGSRYQSYLLQRLQSTNYTMMGVIDPQKAFDDVYDISEIVKLTVLIAGIIIVLIFFIVRQQTKPLSALVLTMKRVRAGKMQEYVEVKGTNEIRELSETYNSMLEEINNHIKRLVGAEEEKRMAEIHALQMQINPHYIYNTLTSVKWLTWQGDSDKSVKVIDAFISLLRNTISNTDEFVTVEKEIENLKNYVFINQARYGNTVNVEFFVLPQCNSYKIPKLILQPFVENAFFHAFPEGKKGTIHVFVKEEKDSLRFEISDNGAGINTQQLLKLQNKETSKTEHFTGIGINNVDDRIKMIYGMDYGINITSEENKGTTIIILLSKRKD